VSGPERPAPGQISTLLRELVHAPETELGGGWESVLRTGAVIGRFELLREVARGGFGVVWEARDRDLGRTVAFKALRGGTRPTVLEQRYLLEAEAAARCSHPNIVTLFDVGRTQHGPYLVLELLQGQTLAARLRRGPMSPGEALRIAVEVAKGLAHAHAQGIVHRDLTPRNVFLCNDGQVKVLDLGMAHVFGRPLVEGGTPGYMAPEQRRGAPEDERTDVYALAAVLCHMLGGELRERVEENDGPVHALPTGAVEPALEALIGRMLELDPVARPRDAGEVLAALTALQRSRTDGNVDRDANAFRGTPPQARAIRARRRRWRRAWLLGGAGALLVAALAVWRLQPRVRAPENPLASARFVMLTDFDGIEQAAAISRDGRFVAFQSDRDGQMDVWVTQVGTGHFSNLTRGSAPEIVNPSLRTLGFSPDGTLVTYWARRRDGGKQSEISVWAAPLLGGHARPYLDGIAEYDWTNDGTRLVYHTPGPGDPMYVRDSWQSEARQIFSAPPGLHGHFLLWSPDRAFIYFVQGSPPDHLDIWRIRPTGGTPERLTHHDSVVTHPVFLNARTLLYLATDANGAGPWIYGLDVEDRTTRRISSGVDSYTSLAASADGRRIVATMASPKGTLWRVPWNGRKAEMSAAHRIALTTGNGSLPRLGPDYLLYVSSKGASDSLWKLQGGTATELWSAPETRIIGAPAVRRDGRRIAFSVDQRGQTTLYVVNPDGTDARVVTSALKLRGAPAWTPDGVAITVASVVDDLPRLFKVPLDGRFPTPFVAEHPSIRCGRPTATSSRSRVPTSARCSRSGRCGPTPAPIARPPSGSHAAHDICRSCRTGGPS